MEYRDIEIIGARNNNLQSVNLAIPKHYITVFTGVSGSGKSSLVFDTIAAESQRQLNETYSAFVRHRLPHSGRPLADSLRNLPASIVIDQKQLGSNARSTVGTATDIQPLLRLLFSRIGNPFVGYANIFSFNHPQGMCPRCEGLGKVNDVDIEMLLDRHKSLNQGAICFPTFAPGTYRWKRYVCSGLFDNDKKIGDYSDSEWKTLLYADDIAVLNPRSGWPPSARFQGVIPRFRRAYLDHEPSRLTQDERESLARVVARQICPDCRGARLNSTVLGCRIKGLNIGEFADMEVRDLLPIMRSINEHNIATVAKAIAGRLEQMISIGLDYLKLSRETGSLSGGELQRVKMVRHLGSSLSDIAYILDEPSAGLHPRDVHQLNELLQQLRDNGNTVLVVEHDPEVIAIADHVIDMGPNAGTKGGRVVYEGDYSGLLHSDTLTGRNLRKRTALKPRVRQAHDYLQLNHVSLHNINDISVSIPVGVLTVITGVAGSGKSTLVDRILPSCYPHALLINQGELHGSRRSTVGSYIGFLDLLRNCFARISGKPVALFSNNGAGACSNCRGNGIIQTDLAFMDSVEIPCDACDGTGYSECARKVFVRGKNIAEVLRMTVIENEIYFKGDPILTEPLSRLERVGLGYLTLEQSTNTLSGGERQRLKLARSLSEPCKLYVIDEPTSGLHMDDVQRLLGIFDGLVNKGSTVIVVEHNLDVIAHADWLIEMGPGAGKYGGKEVFAGTPCQMIADEESITAPYLKEYIEKEER